MHRRSSRPDAIVNEVIRAVGPASMARIATLPVSAAAIGVSSFLAIQYAGASVFGYVALIATIFQLIPFVDLGLGAAVTTAVALRRQDHTAALAASETLRRTFRLLCATSALLWLVVAAIAVLGQWPRILGVPSNEDWGVSLAVVLSLTLFLASVPFGIGQRILVGESQTHILNYLAVLGPVASCFVVWITVLTGGPFWLLAVAQALGVLVTSVACFHVGMRGLGLRIRDLLSSQSLALSVSLKASAGPFLAIGVGVPIAMQSDRLILAHFSDGRNLAIYAICAQMYAPSFSIISAGSVGLWPLFARAKRGLREAWLISFRVLGIFSAVVACGFFVLSPMIGSLISGGEVRVPIIISAAFAGLILVMGLHQPSAMLLTAPRQLKFQAQCVLVMLVINLALSVLLTQHIGASGPVLASCIGIFIAQLIPGVARANKAAR